jgi:hypothetical protein
VYDVVERPFIAAYSANPAGSELQIRQSFIRRYTVLTHPLHVRLSFLFIPEQGGYCVIQNTPPFPIGGSLNVVLSP